MPRLKRFAIVVLASVAGLIVLLVVALTAAALFIDPEAYRPSVQRQVSAALGREVAIDHLAIGKSLYPTIAVTGLRVANPDWASRPDLVTVSSASVKLALLALIRGEIEIGRIEVKGVGLLLERDANGVGNWVFDSRQRKSRGGEAAQLPGFDEVVIRDAQIGWRSDDGAVTDVRIESADAELPANKPLQIETTVVYRQVPIEANLTANTSLGNALSGQPVSASIGLRALDARVNLEVALRNLLDFSDVSINFAANGQQLDKWSALVDQPLPEWGPYRVSGRASLAAGSVKLDNLRMFTEGLTGKTPLMLSRVEIDSGAVVVGQETPTSVQLSGRLDATSFGLEVTTANLAQLTAAGDSIPVDSKVMLDDFELGAEGMVRRTGDLWAFDLMSYVKGDVAAPVRLARGASFKQALLVDLSGRFEGDANQVAATKLRGSVAQTSVSGDVTLRLDVPLGVDGTLALGRLDLASFEIQGDESEQVAEQQKAGPPEWIKAVDADLRLRLERVVGLPIAAAGLSGHATLKGGRLDVRKFRGVIADTRLSADAGLEWKAGRPYVNAKISAPLLDVSMLADESRAAGKKNGDRASVKGAAFDVPLPIAPLRSIDGDLTVDIGQVKGAPVAVDTVRGSAHLTRSRLRVPSFNVSLAGVPVQSTLILDAGSDDAHLSANVSAPRVDIAKLTDELKVDAPFAGTIGQAAATVETRGASLRSWMENARVAARVGSSTLKKTDVDEQLIVERASAIAGPGVDVRAELRGQFGEFPVDLVVTGGRLDELLDEKPLWPKMTAELRTMFGERPVRLSAESALHALLSGRNVPVRAEMRLPNGYATVAGTIADLREPARTPLDVEARVKARAFQPLIRRELLLPDLPLSVRAKANLDEGVITLQRLQFRAGEADLSGDIRLKLKDRVKLTASLSGGALDLRPWLPAPAAREPSSAAAALPESRASKLDRPFDLKAMRRFDAALDIKLRRLISHQFDFDDPSLKADLDSGRLDAAASIAEGGLAVGLTFDASRDLPLVAIRAGMTKLNLETIKTVEASRRVSGVPLISANLKFAGVGATPRGVYESAKGEALVSIGPGQIGRGKKPFMVQAVSTDLVETLLPGRKPDDYMQMECAAVHFDVADGIVSSPDGMAIRFKEVDILGSGAVNLVTREILFGFKAVRRRWFSFSFLDLAGDLATIRGTIEAPRVSLDPGGTLVTGGAAWATAGLSLLATRFWRQLGAADDPCKAIIEKGRTQSDPLDSLIKDLPLPDDLLESLPLPGAEEKQE
ncbi:MAG: AsmA family protein [Betaproteobacteria bacterium]|nr:MAG: AsmA family protein [Betaproteobacteria bacterium]